MRASEIRNLLVQKYGMEAAAVARILDRGELKKLLLSFMVEQQSIDSRGRIADTLLNVAYVIACIFLFILALRSVSSLVGQAYDYKSTFKFKLILSNIKRRNILGAVALSVSLALEVLRSAMTMSTFLSWVLPLGSPYRRLMVPMLSFSINPVSMIKSAVAGSPASAFAVNSGAQSGSFNLDVGPMLTIWLVRWAATQLEELGASTSMDRVQRRHDRRARRDTKQQQSATVSSSSSGGAWGGGERNGGMSAGDMLRSRSTDANWLDDDDDDGMGNDIDHSGQVHSSDMNGSGSSSDSGDHHQREQGDLRSRKQQSTAPREYADIDDNNDDNAGGGEGVDVVDTSGYYTRDDEVDICAAASIAGGHDDYYQQDDEGCVWVEKEDGDGSGALHID